MSASLAAAVAAAQEKISNNIMMLDETQRMSLQEQLRHSVLLPKPNTMSSATPSGPTISVPIPTQRARPPASSLSESQIDVELSYENISRFDDELVIIEVMERGDVEDKLDYKYYLELKRAARLHFEAAMRADEDEAMKEFSEPGVGPPSLQHGPLPTIVPAHIPS